MTDTSFKPDRDRQQRITWRHIASLAAALSALALMAGICSLRPRWQQAIGRLPINLGTAQMQAEAMALAIRQSPPFPLHPRQCRSQRQFCHRRRARCPAHRRHRPRALINGARRNSRS